MLSSLGPDGQHATIAKVIQNELDAEREKVTLPYQHCSQQTKPLREQSAQQFKLLRQQHAAATGSTHTRRPGTLKIDIFKYKGDDEDSLLIWFVKLDDATRVRHIVDEHMQVALTHRIGRTCEDLGLRHQATRSICL
uniref:Uncharacterized protein n=1 Tax=Hyaloperonospora arabidopsidis (strain Emoy2) TaxID=559515 RepID=M4BUA2_HYAAE